MVVTSIMSAMPMRAVAAVLTTAAAWEDDLDAARRLVERGADVDATDETQQSAYLVATSEGHLGILELALASGADVDAKDSWDGTGLIRAAERGHHLVVGRLLRAGIDKDHVNRIGYQAIHEAVWFGADEADELSTVQVLVAGECSSTGRPVRSGSPPSRWLASAAITGSAVCSRLPRPTGPSRTRTRHSSPRHARGTPTPWPLRCGTVQTSGRSMRPGAAPSCSPQRGTTSRQRAFSWLWAPTGGRREGCAFRRSLATR